MMKQWFIIQWEECPFCGGNIEAQTEQDDDKVFDGDSARCTNCNAEGYFTVDEDGGAYANMEDK